MANSNSGVYQLRISVGKTCSILIGKLGNFTFPAGQYVYTGRAKKNLSQRIDRHKKRDKKCFWHIDYLLTAENAQLENITIISENFSNECSENKKLLQGNALIVAAGFGASDCKNNCGAHLLYLGT
ncbi:MAG: GIY-YIG nuclease family protein [Candidatus Marinimicrobia bacterium]|jgi:sugar fermentation stimulation protein A|nr:GIY-YIG nuclease family protein [Candidatus Neomarinimicrobiota bacterium]MDP6610697.1 GIY-YIG nuclease family protein [Candidatus Neomarinimicrobiota bacterium]|tara:strand:- start:957 stop:1334 length:378 start_codon:yes stop_codon:yes gene_type:complete